VVPFRQSQISYAEKYLLLFSAFNAWYRRVTGERIDARALHALMYRDAVWVEYRRGESLERIRPIIRKITILSNVRPLHSYGDWPGSLDGPDDWQGLIHFWYAVRCTLVHANADAQQSYYPLYTQLAYESLNIFMTEVVMRLQQDTSSEIDDEAVRYLYGDALPTRRRHADLYARINVK